MEYPLKKPGRLAEDILADLIPEIIRNFPWQKSMRWGDTSCDSNALYWIRPLKSIVCILHFEDGDVKIINSHIAGIPFGDRTYGHRFHAPQPIKVKCFSDYVDALNKAKVILDPEYRKNIILNDINHCAFVAGLELIPDTELLEEVTGLVEWPKVFMSSFHENYLNLPEEIIRLTIKTHQKCFVTRSSTGKLSNHFMIVANIDAIDNGIEILKGHSRVVNARLADALHFWRCDQNNLPDLVSLQDSAKKFNLDLQKPLDQRMAKLDALNVRFHTKLGTQGERVLRIGLLAQKLLKFTHADPQLVDRAVTLAKADLCTEIVREFPELQGKTGKEYALLQGEHLSVATALEDHYKPRGPSDQIPEDKVAITVALADKLDSLISFWSIDEKPSGSKDPYALRRAALGSIRILLERKINLPLYRFLKDDDLMAFFRERLKLHLRDAGYRHDIIDAAFISQEDNFYMLVELVKCLSDFLLLEEGRKFLSAAKRVIQILSVEEKKEEIVSSNIQSSLFLVDAEKELHNLNTSVNALVQKTMKRNDFNEALLTLSTLSDPIDLFFEKVMVNVSDSHIRKNRLSLLHAVRDTILLVFDIHKINS